MKINYKNLILIILIIGMVIYLGYSIFNNKKETKSDNKEKTSLTTTSTTKTTTESTTTTSTTTTKNATTKTTAKAIQTNTGSNGSKVGKTSNGHTVTYENGAYYVDGYLIVNKTYDFAESWVPNNTNTKITESMNGFCRECIDKEAYNAWKEMKSDAASLGLNLWNQSGYRSYSYQKKLYDGYVNKKGVAAADKSSARPGHSEHQSGLAFDLNTITTEFKDTDEGKWVNENCYLYGYIIRYPEGKNDETGYIFEPWHIRYVGKELAEKLYNNGNWITMEKYFGLTSEY